MATLTIDSTTPSASVNLAVLKSAIDKILTANRRNEFVKLAQDEILLLTEIAYAVTTGTPTSTNTVSSITVTY